MDFESPEVAKDFPGLYAPENSKRSQSRESDYSDEEKLSRKDLLGKRKDKGYKDKGYVAFEAASSEDEILDETRSPGKGKKNKSAFKFRGIDRKERAVKAKEKDTREKKDDDNKASKKEKDFRKESKKIKAKNKEEKKKKERSFKIKDKKKKAGDQLSVACLRAPREQDDIKQAAENRSVICFTCEVLMFDKEFQRVLGKKEERPIFGIPLHEAVDRNKSHDGIEIPVIVRECIDYIEEHGLACEGIYRISGVKSKVRQLKSQYNRGEKVYLYEHEPHIVASLLKQFLRDLPEPILTTEIMPKFEETAAMKNEPKKVEALMKLIASLPTCNRLLLSWIFVHMLHVVKLEKTNKMSLQNVSIVLSPAMQISHRVLHALFSYSDVLFKGVEIKKYVPPVEPDSSRLSLELPDSPTAIEEELYKQENLLNIIHEELNAGLRDTEKEEQLWEVQRVVTQMKRKLRFLRQVQNAAHQSVEENKDESEPQRVGTSDGKESYPASPEYDKNSLSGINSASAVPSNQPLLPVLPNLETEKKIEDQSATLSEVRGNEVNSSHIEQAGFSCKESDSIQELGSRICEPVVDPSATSRSMENSEMYSCKDECSATCDDGSEELIALHCEEMKLRIEEEELLLLGDELRRKISSEKQEIERLQQEIAEYQMLYKYRPFSLDSTENSSSDSDDSSVSNGEESDAVHILQELLKKNILLETSMMSAHTEHWKLHGGNDVRLNARNIPVLREGNCKKMNKELSQKVQQEREACVNLKVYMKMALKESQFMQL